MRIAVVSPRLPTAALPMRGVTRFEQLHRFAAAGHEVRGVVPLPWPTRRRFVPPEEPDGPVVVAHPRYARVPAPWRALERRLFASAAATALRNPAVVLAHSATLPGGLLGRTGQAPFVVTIHDHELYDWAPHRAGAARHLTRILQAADAVVYVSEALRRAGTALAGAHRSLVIPIGIESYDDVSAAPPDHFRMCTVSRLIARKRIDALLRAFAAVVAEQPGAELVIVGDGPERNSLTRLAQALGVSAHVRFTGALDARAARVEVARATVMALPSVRESLGAAYLEAMSLGVPVVATQGEGIAAHIEDGVSGVLVPPADDATLVAALRALAADPARARRLGEAGRRRFLAGGFTWQDNAAAYLALFADLLKGRATTTA